MTGSEHPLPARSRYLAYICWEPFLYLDHLYTLTAKHFIFARTIMCSIAYTDDVILKYPECL